MSGSFPTGPPREADMGGKEGDLDGIDGTSEQTFFCGRNQETLFMMHAAEAWPLQAIEIEKTTEFDR